MKPDELYARLCIAPDATAEVIALFNEVDWPTAVANVPKNTPAQSAAQEAAREVAWGAAREVAWGAARGAALLAGCMVVRDLIDRKHMDTALTLSCRWLAYIKE